MLSARERRRDVCEARVGRDVEGADGSCRDVGGSVPVLTVCPRDGALGKSYSAALLQWPLIIAGRDKILLA